jgi:integrase
MSATEKPANFAVRNAKAKLARRIARLVRAAGLSYEDWRAVNKMVRRWAGLQRKKPARRLPNVLTDDAFKRFYRVVDDADDALHAVMLRLLFYTAVRVSELVSLRVEDVDLAGCRIRVNGGKGDKDRYVLFGKSFATTLRAYLASHPENVNLFESRLGTGFTARRVQQIVKRYADLAGVRATPHTFRHQAITWLTRQGMADSDLQLITGHASKATLAVYQHVALGKTTEERYNAAMKEVEL